MHFFIIPVNYCNSTCRYCFSNNRERKVISFDTYRKAVFFFKEIDNNKAEAKTNITFHGGEPLLAGIEFYKAALPLLQEVYGNNLNISIQSNLWNLDDHFIKLFSEFDIKIGTSLDGPEKITDSQRSDGYFKRTMVAIELLKEYGISPGCIATITSSSSKDYKNIFDFFLESELPFEIHPAIRPIGYSGDNQVFISPKEYADFLIQMLEYYLRQLDRIKISTLDTLARNISRDKSGLCTFAKCLGNYLAIDPEGDLYTCNRFVGNKKFSVGNINYVKSWDDIKQSQAWRMLEEWQNRIDVECADCLYKNICHGGCPYVAFAEKKDYPAKDPYCESYKAIYRYILDKGTEEFFSNNYLHSLELNTKQSEDLLYKVNPLMYLLEDNPHPVDLIQSSKKIVAAALLGKTSNPKHTTDKLFELGIITSVEIKLPIIEQFFKELSLPPHGFNNLYLHITGSCNLLCTHCYSYSGNEVKSTQLSLEIILQTIQNVRSLNFKKIIFTGGEPLLYPQIEKLLDELYELKRQMKLPVLVLRTNLSCPIERIIIDKVYKVFDQVVVSIDGSEQIHDRRRGEGSFQKVISNLELLRIRSEDIKLSFACVLDQEILSPEELENERRSIELLKTRYSIDEIRYLPLLPIGRAKAMRTKRNIPENIGVREWINRKHYFRINCGLGQSVMIDSNGEVYPCHVMKEIDKQLIGNVYDQKLANILQGSTFTQLRELNVNTNYKCSNCEVRYLCGGICKIWEDQDCSDLFNKAKFLLDDAFKILNISNGIDRIF